MTSAMRHADDVRPAERPSPEVLRQLAPDGVLQAGINLGNPLLVTGRDPDGRPTGIAPDMAAAIADALGVPCVLRGYPRPGETADAIAECGIVLIAAEPERGRTIAFSPGYVGIPATYLVKPDVQAEDVADIDRPGLRIVVSERSAYDLWLTRNLSRASLVRIKGLDAAFEHFRQGDAEVLAGLRPALLDQSERVAGSRVLAGDFDTVQQAVGTAIANAAAAAFLDRFVVEARRTGLVAGIVARHGIRGLGSGPTPSHPRP